MGDGKESKTSSSSSSSLQGSQPFRHFEFHEILQATHDFDESLLIGHGGFGKVYRGDVNNGSCLVVAAIKRLDSMSNQGATEFWAEVEMLSKLRYCNLVSLFGYCNHGKEMILVYEYMPIGTLEDHLHKLATPLSWLQRLNICIGAARGLHYLHTGIGVQVGVIHRDVKSSNILLHETWAAKISDFGLSKIGPTNQPSTCVNTLVKGTFGYFDPDYYATGKLTRKSDVYAFGVVLLEVLCRKRAVDTTLDEEQWNLARWAQESIQEGKVKHIIDYGIKGQISAKCLKEFVRIVERCLHHNPKQRSTMAGVVAGLESILALQEKFNNSLQAVGNRTIFSWMVDMLPFLTNGDNSGQGDSQPSSSTKGNISTNTDVALDTREVPSHHKIPSLKEFKFADLKRATNKFNKDLLLGRGGFGPMILGWIDENTFAPCTPGDGIAVAVKQLQKGSSQGQNEWQTEVSFLGRLAHPNIITLLGYCNDEKDEHLLVYEYMQNRSFERFLFTNETNIGKPLSWGTRLLIMIGVARGLMYLHSLRPQVIFRDVKTSNILLDQDFNAKLADFGLAKLGPGTGETHNIATGHLTVKSDMYGFGVVLLETLTGLRVLDTKRPTQQHNLVEWTRKMLERREKLKKIMDPRLEQNYPLEAAVKCAKLILRCLGSNPKDRPSSEEVVHRLEQIHVINM